VIRLSRPAWRALVGGLILGLPAGALFFVRVPVLIVHEVRPDRAILTVQVRTGERFVLSYRHSVTQGLVFGTFQIEGDGSLSVKETAFASPGPGLPEPRPGEEYEISGGLIRHRPSDARFPELSVFVHPFTQHTLVVKGESVNISEKVAAGALVKIRVERQSLWRWGLQKIGALLSRAR
jgi:hypothetical protein